MNVLATRPSDSSLSASATCAALNGVDPAGLGFPNLYDLARQGVLLYDTVVEKR